MNSGNSNDGFINRDKAEEMLKKVPGATVEMLDQLQGLTADLKMGIVVGVNLASHKAQELGILPSLFLATFASNVIGAVVDYAAGALQSKVEPEFRAELSAVMVKVIFDSVRDGRVPEAAELMELFRQKTEGYAPKPSDN